MLRLLPVLAASALLSMSKSKRVILGGISLGLLVTAAIFVATLLSSSRDDSNKLLPEPFIPGDGHHFGASCQLCMSTRCGRNDGSGCNHKKDYLDSTGDQVGACMCGCCALQCNIPRDCESSPLALNSNAAAPFGWFTAGGGFRAMSTGMAVGRNLERIKAFSMPELVAVASNSGGSWFVTQMAFSQDFYDQVTGRTGMREILMDWLNAHREVVAPVTLDEIRSYLGPSSAARAQNVSLEMDALYERAGALARGGHLSDAAGLYELCGVVALTMRYDGFWSLAIERMMELTAKGLGKLPASPKNRVPAFGMPALHFQTAYATTATLVGTDGSAVRSVALDSAGAPLVASVDAVPVQFVVGGRSSAEPQAAGFSLSPLAERIAKLTNGTKGSAGDAPPAPFGGQAPGAAFVAGMSSAALGVFGSYSMLERFVADQPAVGLLAPLLALIAGPAATPCDPLAGTAAYFVCLFGVQQPLTLAEYGMCNQLTGPAHARCAYPAQRLLDGGFVDNIGGAQTLAAMQRSAKPDSPLKLLLSANGECSEPGPDMTAPLSATNGCSFYDIAALFAGAYAGPVITVSWGVRQPSPQIFSQSWRELKFEYVPGSAPDDATKVGGAYIADFVTTTVANADFGVAAGTKVHVLLLVHLVPVALMMGFIPFQYPILAEYAGRLADSSSLDRVLQSWLKTPIA